MHDAKDNKEKLWSQFTKFYASLGYANYPAAPAYLPSDSTALFTTSGMMQFKNVFLGKAEPKAQKLITNQPCIRMTDVDQIGKSQIHATSFNMLGAFDFKVTDRKKVIADHLDFLKHLDLDLTEFHLTCHPKDVKSVKACEELTLAYGMKPLVPLKENVWSAGDGGPFGYCVEVFLAQIEVLNTVFIEHKKTTMMDMGLGLARLNSVVNGGPILDRTLANKMPSTDPIKQTQILDLLTTSSIMFDSKMMPNNKGRCYVMRQCIRKAVDLFDVELEKSGWQSIFNDRFVAVILSEKHMMDACKTKMASLIDKQHGKKEINSSYVQDLYSTHGIRPEWTLSYLKDKYGLHLDYESYYSELAPETVAPKTKINQEFGVASETSTTAQTTITELVSLKDRFYVEVAENPLYVEGGGQVGGIGTLNLGDQRYQLTNTLRHADKVLSEISESDYHALAGQIGQKVKVVADQEHNYQSAQSHTAHHLFLLSLKNFFKTTVMQTGSHIAPKKFKCEVKMPVSINELTENLPAVTNYYHQLIAENHPVEIVTLEANAAAANGTTFLTEAIYPAIVRVVKVAGSMEACCGSHVASTSMVPKTKFELQNKTTFTYVFYGLM